MVDLTKKFDHFSALVDHLTFYKPMRQIMTYILLIGLGWSFESFHYCRQYSADDTSVCDVCSASIHSEDKKCVGVPKEIPNCNVYADETRCSLCLPGYKLQADLCYPIEYEEPCYWPVSALVCLLCKPQLVHFTLMLTCGGETSSIPHCRYGAWNKYTGSSCLRCETGFTYVQQSEASSNSCVESKRDLFGCWISKDGKSCSQCDFNFYIENGKCLVSPAYHFDLPLLKVVDVNLTQIRSE